MFLSNQEFHTQLNYCSNVKAKINLFSNLQQCQKLKSQIPFPPEKGKLVFFFFSFSPEKEGPLCLSGNEATQGKRETARDRRWNLNIILWALDPEVRGVGIWSSLKSLALPIQPLLVRSHPILPLPWGFSWIVSTSINHSPACSPIVLVNDIKSMRHFLFLGPCFFGL